jgi:hypothetical protein
VKSILVACDQDEIIDALVADLQNYERGIQHDETQSLEDLVRLQDEVLRSRCA